MGPIVAGLKSGIQHPLDQAPPFFPKKDKKKRRYRIGGGRYRIGGGRYRIGGGGDGYIFNK